MDPVFITSPHLDVILKSFSKKKKTTDFGNQKKRIRSTPDKEIEEPEDPYLNSTLHHGVIYIIKAWKEDR